MNANTASTHASNFGSFATWTGFISYNVAEYNKAVTARFHRVDTILGHLSARGHIESAGGLWRLKARH